jgi:hypothetical protein
VELPFSRSTYLSQSQSASTRLIHSGFDPSFDSVESICGSCSFFNRLLTIYLTSAEVDRSWFEGLLAITQATDRLINLINFGSEPLVQGSFSMGETALYVLVGFGEYGFWRVWVLESNCGRGDRLSRPPISTVLAAISVISGTGFEPALT